MSKMAATMDGVLKDFLQTTSSRLPFTSPIEKRLLSWKKVGRGLYNLGNIRPPLPFQGER